MFWAFNFVETSSHIDALLNKEDVTLFDLMDEDDILQECKSQNKKLIDFISQKEQMSRMIDLILTEPDDDLEEQTKYKYPNTACEVLTCDVNQINDELIAPEHLARLSNFIDNHNPLNPLLASFFSKVMSILISRKSEIIFEYLTSKEDFVATLVHHIGTSAIMDLLLRLITCVETPQTRLDILTWLNDEKLVQQLVSLMVPTQTDEIHSNVSQCLCDIICTSRERLSHFQESADPDPLLATIESKEIVTSLLDNIFSDELSESCVCGGVSIVQSLLEFHKSGEGELFTALDNERISQSLPSIIEAVLPRLKDFHNILLEPPKQYYSIMETTFGCLDPPLGNTRLLVIRLICSLVSVNRHDVNSELALLGTTRFLLNLVFRYPWNNFLHTQVELYLHRIFRNPPTLVGGNSKNILLSQAIIDLKLLDLIRQEWSSTADSESKGIGNHKGYMGHMIQIANDVHSLMQNTCQSQNKESEEFNTYINELDQKDLKSWEDFVTTHLADINKVYEVDIVPSNIMRTSSSDDEDDVLKNIPYNEDSLQRAFSDYQLRQMTSNLDHVGFNEEEFLEQEAKADAYFSNRISSIDFTQNAEISDAIGSEQLGHIDKALSNKIRHFEDNSDDEEDIWDEKEITFSETYHTMRTRLHCTRTDSNSLDNTSSDSSNDRDSPEITQENKMHSNSMDIDTLESSDDTNLVAMDTDYPWEPAASFLSSTNNDNWANFESENGESEGWANFNNAQGFMEENSCDAFDPVPGDKRVYNEISSDTNSLHNSNINGSGDFTNFNAGDHIFHPRETKENCKDSGVVHTSGVVDKLAQHETIESPSSFAPKLDGQTYENDVQVSTSVSESFSTLVNHDIPKHVTQPSTSVNCLIQLDSPSSPTVGDCQ